jgi:hypothetical protein
MNFIRKEVVMVLKQRQFIKKTELINGGVKVQKKDDIPYRFTKKSFGRKSGIMRFSLRIAQFLSSILP